MVLTIAFRKAGFGLYFSYNEHNVYAVLTRTPANNPNGVSGGCKDGSGG